jgi:hypothetical protein
VTFEERWLKPQRITISPDEGQRFKLFVPNERRFTLRLASSPQPPPIASLAQSPSSISTTFLSLSPPSSPLPSQNMTTANVLLPRSTTEVHLNFDNNRQIRSVFNSDDFSMCLSSSSSSSPPSTETIFDQEVCLDELSFKVILSNFIELLEKNKKCSPSEVKDYFATLLTNLQSTNPVAIEKLKAAFPEWNWSSSASGFNCEMNAETVIHRLKNLNI